MCICVSVCNVPVRWTPELFERDAWAVPLPFDRALFGSTGALTIGYYAHDMYFDAAPACQRAVREAAALLQARGHKLVPFAPPRVNDAVRLFYGLLAADGNFEGFYNALQGEKLHELCKKTRRTQRGERNAARHGPQTHILSHTLFSQTARSRS